MTLTRWFRYVALAEGISYLVLLGVAMPLKYLAGKPLAVQLLGLLHGWLFVAFVVLAALMTYHFSKGIKWFIRAFILSLLPFGTFVLEKELRTPR